MEKFVEFIKNLPEEEAKAFRKKVASAASAAEIVAIIKELGFDIPEKDAEAIFAMLNQDTNEKLSSAEMDTVAGGFKSTEYGPDNAPWYFNMFWNYSACNECWYLFE